MQNKFNSTRTYFRVLSGLSLLSLTIASRAAMSGLELINNTDLLLGGAADMRDVGSGTLNIVNPGAAIAPGAITKAYLYWAGPTSSPSPLANATVSFNGSTVTGANIGFSSDNHWGYPNSQAYRADVTSLVGALAPGLNSIPLANFAKGGIDPDSGSYLINVNGASLVLMYNDGNPANDRDLLVFGGNDSNLPSSFDGYGWGTTASGVQYSGHGPAFLHLGVSDGQEALVDDTLTLNGNPLFPSDWNGTSVGGTPENGKWDLESYNISSILSPGANSLTLFDGIADFGFDPLDPFNPLFDYTSLIHGVIDLPGDSYAVPEPTTIISGLAFASLFGARLLRRRR